MGAAPRGEGGGEVQQSEVALEAPLAVRDEGRSHPAHIQISAWASNQVKAVLGPGAAPPFKPPDGIAPGCALVLPVSAVLLVNVVMRTRVPAGPAPEDTPLLLGGRAWTTRAPAVPGPEDPPALLGEESMDVRIALAGDADNCGLFLPSPFPTSTRVPALEDLPPLLKKEAMDVHIAFAGDADNSVPAPEDSPPLLGEEGMDVRIALAGDSPEYRQCQHRRTRHRCWGRRAWTLRFEVATVPRGDFCRVKVLGMGRADIVIGPWGDWALDNIIFLLPGSAELEPMRTTERLPMSRRDETRRLLS
ncbi:unnamed protein product [Closterium sp. Naga37s-1]|nr:unnamed protein product [Closterium sp. Naga37s-1]